jgi:hypothetical protein
MRFFAVLFSLMAVSAMAKGAFKASDKNWSSDVIGSGKNAFVKFLAPW